MSENLLDNTAVLTEVLYNRYNTGITSANILTLEGEDKTYKLSLKVVDNKLAISTFDELEQEEELIALDKKEVLQLTKLINDLSKSLEFPIIAPEPPEEVDPETP